MANAAEGASAKQNIAAALAGGVETLSLQQEITFTQYVRLVLPLDGFVFWVRSDLLTASALFNAFEFNKAELNESSVLAAAAPTITISGSFHYSTRVDQNEAETEANNTVIFTALSPVQQFNDLQPNILWIAEYGGDIEGFDGPITFAFSARGRYYNAADLFHYSGTAVLPAFKANLINSADQLASRELWISNSLPIWLQLSNYVPPYYPEGFTCSLDLYPSFLVPDNLTPPYGVIHIGEEDTESDQAAPFYDSTLSEYSLAHDRVKVTLYGLTNEAALDFKSAVLQFSYDYNTIGIMNMPTMRDEKRIAQELGVIAQKKSIRFEVSYNQSILRDAARAYINSVIVNYLPNATVANFEAYKLTPWMINLPTEDPALNGKGSGVLWNNGGWLSVSSGTYDDPSAYQWAISLPNSTYALAAGQLYNNNGIVAISAYGYTPLTPIWLAQLPVNNGGARTFNGMWNNGLLIAVA